MKKFAVLSVAALMGVSTLTASTAEARGGGAVAAGIIGGLAAGALLGAAVSDAHEGSRYDYAPPASVYGYRPAPVGFYQPTPVVRSYEYEAPAYETRRIFSYERVPVAYGYRPAGPYWHEDWDRPYGYRSW